MARRIITEADIIEAAGAGKTVLETPEGECIVTDQARDRALELGVTLACGGSPACPAGGCAPGTDGPSNARPEGQGAGGTHAPAGAAAGTTSGATAGAAGGAAPRGADASILAEQVVKALRARLPQGVDAAEAERLVRAAVAARMGGSSGGERPAGERQSAEGPPGDAGFAFVEASAMLKPLGQGTGPQDKALLAEALAAKGQAKLSAGYLAWEKASFSRSVDEPEVCVVIEGELHLTVGGRTVIAKPGDLAYLPQGTKAVYSAPGRVVLACVNTRG